MSDVPLMEMIDGLKFMWDGKIYDTQPQAHDAAHAYQAQSFETRVLAFGDRFLVYSRRVVKEIVLA